MSVFRITFDTVTAGIERGFRAAGAEGTKLEGNLNKVKATSLEVREATLKVEAAQVKAAQTADRYGAESLKAAQANVRLERAQKDLADRTEVSSAKLDKSGSKVRGLGLAVKAAGAAFVGGELIRGVKDLEQASEALQTSQARAATQVKASGQSYNAHSKDIDEVIKKTSELSGITRVDLTDAFTNVDRSTGSVSKSLKLVGLAADIARAKNIGAAQAGQLLGKAATGNITAVKRLGLAFTPTTSAVDALKASTKDATKAQVDAAKQSDLNANKVKLLGLLHDKFAGQAKAFGQTSAGAYARFDNSVEELKENLGGALAPTMAKAATAAAKFVDGIQDGTGAGGKFAHVLGDVVGFVKKNSDTLKTAATVLAPVAAGFVVASVAAAGFSAVMEINPIVAMVTAIAALTVGVIYAYNHFDNFRKVVDTSWRTIKPIVMDMASGFKTAFGGIIQIAKGAAEVLSGIFHGDFGKALNGLKDLFAGELKLIGGLLKASTAPLRAGAKALAGGIADGISSLGGTVYNAGKTVVLAGLHGAGALLGDFFSFGKKVISSIVGGITSVPGAIVGGIKKVAGGALGAVTGIFHKGRNGGRLTAGGFKRFAAGGLAAASFGMGGMIPSLVSPGEVVAYGNQSWTVPGTRVAADSVFAPLPAGAAVLTDDGQARLAMGASMAETLATQLPHFATGGVVSGKVSTFGPPGEGAGTTATGVSSSAAGIALRPGATYQTGRALLGKLFQVRIGHHLATLKDIDLGPNQSTGRRIDVTGAGARKLGLDPLNFPTDSIGSATPVGSKGVSNTSTRLKLGDRYLDSARTAGFQAGLDGATRVSGDLLSSITGGSIGTLARNTGNTIGAASKGGVNTHATGTSAIDGVRVANWIVGILKEARSDGVKFSVSSGFRTLAQQTVLWNKLGRNPKIVARPGTSNHEGSTYPKGAVDLSNPGWRNMVAWLAKHPKVPLHHYTEPADPYHFSATGHRRGGLIGMRIPSFRTGTPSVGSLISATTRPAGDDKAAVDKAFDALAKRFADTARVGFDKLVQIAANATKDAARARKAGDTVKARRYDAVANTARAEQGIRLASPITRLTATQARLDYKQQLTNDALQYQGIDQGSAAGINSELRVGEDAKKTLASKRAGLQTALARAKKLGNKDAVKQIGDSLQDLDGNLADRAAALADLARQLPKQQAAERIGKYTSALTANSLAQQAASFTLGGDDDRTAARGRLGVLQGEDAALTDEIGKAVARGDQASADDMTQQLIAIRDEINTTNQTLRYSAADEQIAGAQTGQTEDKVAAALDGMAANDAAVAKDNAALLTDTQSELAAAKTNYAAAIAASDQDAIQKYGNEIIGLAGAIQDLTQAVNSGLAQAIADLTAEVAKSNAFAESVSSVTGREVTRALADLMSGEIVGRGVQSRRQTAGDGRVTSY